jgi:uridine phosphorylase
MKQPHILCSENDVTPYVLLPGDPMRVTRVAGFLDQWEEIAFNREYRSVKGLYKGIPVTVVSTGIGGPSMVIALEELISCGGKYFIRIGSAGEGDYTSVPLYNSSLYNSYLSCVY